MMYPAAMTNDLPRCAECRTTIELGQNVTFRADGRVQHVGCPEVLCPVCSLPILPREPIRRDGEAMLHGNCWMRRARAAEREARQPDRVAIIRAKLAAGTLPGAAPLKTWGGPSSGRLCDGCGDGIALGGMEYEVDFTEAATIRLHRGCFDIWEVERGNGHHISGGSAASPWTVFFDLGVARLVCDGRAALAEFLAASDEALQEAREMRLLSRQVRERRYSPVGLRLIQRRLADARRVRHDCIID